MRYDQISVGGEYAFKYDLREKGKLPLAVVRVKVLEKDVDHTVRRYAQAYGSGQDDKVRGIRVEVQEILYDPKWSYGREKRDRRGRKDKVKVGRGAMRNQDDVGIGDAFIAEGGHDFVAQWDDYAAQRGEIESAANEKEAAEWERKERRKIIAERLKSLGFTVKPHNSPWRKGFVPGDADYTQSDGRLSLDALDRLVQMAEQASVLGVETPPPDPHADRLNVLTRDEDDDD